MRLLHTSDWHLGRQFHNVSLLEDQRHILAQIVQIVREKNVDVLLIAGDIYDRSVPPANAVALLDDFLHEVNQELDVAVILIAGNHDGADRLAFAARQLARAGIYIAGPLDDRLEPVLLSDGNGEVAFYTLPYADPATVRDIFDVEVHHHDDAIAFLIQRINAQQITARRRVLMSHCFIDGGESCESERPLSIGGADRVSPKHFLDFNYVALGHLHGPQFKLQESIRYSGSILKYSFSESRQHKSVTLVDMDANGDCQLQKIPLNAKRDMRIIEGYLQDIIDQAKQDEHREDYLLIRLLDTHAILNVMSKLREVYPNLLHVERPGLQKAGERTSIDSRDKIKGELPLFLDFYQQMTGDALSESGATLVAGMLDDIHRGRGK